MTTPATNSIDQPTCDSASKRQLAVMVLMGGASTEREVSLASGTAVAGALASRGHNVTRVDIRPDDLSALQGAKVDVVFIALHGSFGEDGQLQRILDELGLKYVGSGPDASRLGLDKAAAKQRFGELGVPTAPATIAEPGNETEAIAPWTPPVVIKPVAEGSSVGCVMVRDAAELAPAVHQAVLRYGRCLIEQYIDGPELTVGVLGDRALPVCEIRSARDFYDYAAKYQDDQTDYVFDPDLPEDLLNQVQRMSLAAHRALGCRDMSRVDWIVDAATMQPYCLEVNTIPGFTAHSLLPKAAGRVGMGFADLCEDLIYRAMRR